MTHTQSRILFILSVFALCLFVYLLSASQRVDASVSVSNEYIATSTAANTLYGATITSTKLIKTGTGTFGSFVITGANTGIINFYDATTTNVSLRTNNVATSSILLASFPASTAAGTYTFDAALNNGLLIDLPSGNMATGTVMYRN